MIEKVLEKLKPFLLKIRQKVGLLVLIAFGMMYGFLIYNSNKLAQEQPSEVRINEKFQGAKRPKIDESVAQQLMSLEEQNVEIKSIFDQARNNPFSE